MIAQRLVCLTIVLLVALWTGGLSVAQSPSMSLNVLVNQVLSLFPKVEGEVIEVQGRSVTLTLGRRDGLQPGIELTVYREGRELRHPKTGELLGRAEQQLGRVSVAEVQESYSTGSLTQAQGVRPGDRVRVSAGKVKLTVLPLLTGVKESLVEATVHELVNGLTQTGRFQILLGDQIAVWLAQERIPPEEFLQGKGMDTVAQRFKVDQLLTIHFKRVQNKPYMEVLFFALPRSEPLLATSLFVPSSIKPAGQGQFSAGGQPRQTSQPKQRSLLARILGGEMEAGTYSSGSDSLSLKEIARFGFPVLGMDVAVSPKDGVPRVLITDGYRLFLYRLVNQALEPEWTYTRTMGLVLSVQLADLDGDGTFEVVVNQHHREHGLTSTVLTTRNGKPELFADGEDWILLAVDTTGEGVKRALWGQRYSPDTFFSPTPPVQLVVRNRSLVSERRGPLAPPSFRAIGATLSNITGKGTRALAFVDEHQRLQVSVEGQEMWRSSTAVGGGYIKAEIFKQSDRAGRSYFYTMEPYPLSVDLDGDGVEEIVIPQNRFEGFLAVVYRGPTGIRLQSINTGHEGPITALGAIPGASSPSLIATVVRFKNLLKTSGETQIIMTVPE